MMKLKVLATISLLIFSCVCGFCQDKGQEEYVFSYKNENRPMFDNDDTGAKFREWIDSHVRYPKALKKEGIQGRVAVGFTITRQGRLTEVKSSINGQTYILGYCHLQAGNAVAVNPRTLQPFKVNDFVFRGEILGYTGRTGNAHNVNNPHLHLSMKQTNGKRVDPAPFINGKVHFDVKNKEAFIDSIICD